MLTEEEQNPWIFLICYQPSWSENVVYFWAHLVARVKTDSEAEEVCRLLLIPDVDLISEHPHLMTAGNKSRKSMDFVLLTPAL